MQLLNAAGAGSGGAIEVRQPYNRELNQLKTWFVWGTFGGATVTLEISPDDIPAGAVPSNWFSVTGASLTAPGALNVDFRARWVRAVVTGGAGQSINSLLK